uniref:Conotoxin-like unassigned superfamily 13 n=1 Tax=Conus ermineus TaxID=55423 RepID=A0A346CIG6_CONER|nr:conotoxin-like precursor unassigned superfamily 13 [Conus ermineus]
MLSMLAWTLMTAMVVMNAKSQFCPVLTDSYRFEHRCAYDNSLCGKEVSGSCTSTCYCRSGRMCLRNSDHTITVVKRYINNNPVKESYHTCVALSGLPRCSGNRVALYNLVPESSAFKSVEVRCRCPSPNVYLNTGLNQVYTCAPAPQLNVVG